LTDLRPAEIDGLLGPGRNPRDAKEALGMEIVTQYHGAEAAERSAAEFRRRASGEDPDEIPDAAFSADELDGQGRVPAFVLVHRLGLETSASKARRVIEQGGFNLGPRRESITDPKTLVHVPDGLIVRVGKRKIVRVRLC